MRKVKPKSAHEVYGGFEKGSKKMYPEFSIDHDQFPEAKDMGVGEKHKITLHVKKVDHSESRFQNKSGFEIHNIHHHGPVKSEEEGGDEYDKEDEKEGEDGEDTTREREGDEGSQHEGKRRGHGHKDGVDEGYHGTGPDSYALK